jgi:hypothetical protein
MNTHLVKKKVGCKMKMCEDKKRFDEGKGKSGLRWRKVQLKIGEDVDESEIAG